MEESKGGWPTLMELTKGVGRSIIRLRRRGLNPRGRGAGAKWSVLLD